MLKSLPIFPRGMSLQLNKLEPVIPPSLASGAVSDSAGPGSA